MVSDFDVISSKLNVDYILHFSNLLKEDNDYDHDAGDNNSYNNPKYI
jgi:hypothetical protein